MPERYDVIVVGAGPNGLTAGAYLAKAGQKVLFLERRHETGGGLNTEEFSGFRFNLHAVYMMMMDVMPPYQDLRLEDLGCTYVRPEVQLSLLLRDGKALTLYRDMERSVESIARFSRRDAERFREVYRECQQIADDCLIPATYTLPMPPIDHAVMFQQSELGQRILKLSEKSPREIVENWGFESAPLNALLLHLACMWGLDPDLTGVGYMVPLYINRMQNVALVRGGSHRLSSAIQKAAVLNGASVLEVAEVARIDVSGGAATGVELSDGRRFEGKVIVTSTDPVTTFTRLIPEQVSTSASPSLELAKAWEWESQSMFGVHLALREAPRYTAAQNDPAVQEALIKIMGYDSPEEVLEHIRAIKRGELGVGGHATTTTDYDPMQAPVDTTPGAAVARWESMTPSQLKGGRWEDTAESYADRLLAMWRTYAPNVDRKSIIRRYVYSPQYIEQKLVSMVRGSIKHGAYVPLQMGYNRPNIECSGCRTPIRNLYLCGASTYPGGMILLGGGYNAAQVVAQDLGIQPWWREPDQVVRAREKGLVQ